MYTNGLCLCRCLTDPPLITNIFGDLSDDAADVIFAIE